MSLSMALAIIVGVGISALFIYAAVQCRRGNHNRKDQP